MKRENINKEFICGLTGSFVDDIITLTNKHISKYYSRVYDTRSLCDESERMLCEGKIKLYPENYSGVESVTIAIENNKRKNETTSIMIKPDNTVSVRKSHKKGNGEDSFLEVNYTFKNGISVKSNYNNKIQASTKGQNPKETSLAEEMRYEIYALRINVIAEYKRNIRKNKKSVI